MEYVTFCHGPVRHRVIAPLFVLISVATSAFYPEAYSWAFPRLVRLHPRRHFRLLCRPGKAVVTDIRVEAGAVGHSERKRVVAAHGLVPFPPPIQTSRPAVSSTLPPFEKSFTPDT